MKPPTSILFVCTGNACRSPMAEAIARHLLKQKGLKNIKVFSRGTQTSPGQQTIPYTGWVLTEAQIPFGEHQPQRLTGKDLRQAKLVLGMAREHVETVLKVDPRAYGRTFLLQEYVNQVSREIADPIGKPLNDFRKCRDDLRSILEKWVSQLSVPQVHRKKHSKQVKSRRR